MHSLDEPSDSRLDQAIANYATTLKAIEEVAPSPSLEQIIEVLVARDVVEHIKLNSEIVTGKSLADLIQLDRRLKAQAEILAQTAQLADCRRSMQPPDSAWWWFLEPPPPPEPWLSRFDWFWNLLTVGCLVVAGTFATNTAQAFSTSGFDLLGTFSTIAQGAGLVLVAGGALTDQGQKAVERIWSSLKIPTRFHAEATFIVAGLLLFTSYSIHRHLPQIGEFYYQQGQAAEAEDQWLVAKDNYERALKFIPPDATNVQSKLQISLGKIHERLGQLSEAQKHYESAALSNDPEGRLRLGRVNLLQALQAVLWTGEVDAEQQPRLRDAENYLDLAQQNLTDKPQKDEGTGKQQVSIQTQRLRAEVYINQGILLWAKGHLEAPNQVAKDEWLDQAEADFKQAADLEYDLPTIASGRRADCYYKIAVYLNAKIKTKKHQELKRDLQQTQQAADDCVSAIARQSSHDLYDGFLMSRAMEAKLGLAASDNPQK
jgi:tetratricopeptide (TPR) repeat protein